METNKLKKFLPVAILLIAILVVGGIVMATRGGNTKPQVEEEEQVADVPFNQRPVVTLIPRADGHWLDLTISGIDKVQGASTMEYLFLYTTASGGEQGSSGGPYDLSSEDTVEEELLLGTTSSGNYYYDEGVESGELTLRYRNDDGKLIGKVTVPWTRKDSVESVEMGGMTYTLEDPDDIFVLALTGFGLPAEAPNGGSPEPVGFFTSDEYVEGMVSSSSGTLYRWNESEWETVEADSETPFGIFISTN